MSGLMTPSSLASLVLLWRVLPAERRTKGTFAEGLGRLRFPDRIFLVNNAPWCDSRHVQADFPCRCGECAYAETEGWKRLTYSNQWELRTFRHFPPTSPVLRCCVFSRVPALFAAALKSMTRTF